MNPYKAEIFFMTEDFIIMRYFNERGNKYKIRYQKNRTEKPISHERVNEIVYGKR